MGASNDNLEEALKTDPKTVCGLKIFMGSSTGNMLVDNQEVLEKIFGEVNHQLIAHCEDEGTIKHNLEKYKHKFECTNLGWQFRRSCSIKSVLNYVLFLPYFTRVSN